MPDVRFNDEQRDLLREEAEWFTASIGDNIEHSTRARDDKPPATEILLREAGRLQLAIAVCRAIETGTLGAIDTVLHLPAIRDMIAVAGDEYANDARYVGDDLQRFIVRGTEDGYGFSNCDRAESIAAYRENVDRARRRRDACARFLADITERINA